jgi:tellurite methyltransferase
MSNDDRARWQARYRTASPGPAREPAPFLTSLEAELPRAGAALDVAGGAGRNALWLARRGLAVTLVDIAPAALALAGAAAQAEGLAVTLREADLDHDPLPPGPFVLVVCIDYLRRELFAAFPEVLAPGGLLVFAQPTRSNLTRHPHPSARFLLEDGELPRLVRGLEIVRHDQAWFPGDPGGEVRHEARLVARKT